MARGFRLFLILVVLALTGVGVAWVLGAFSPDKEDEGRAPEVVHELFSVPVRSYRTLEIDDFNRLLDAAREAGEPWVENPLWISLAFLEDLEGHTVGIVRADSAAEAPAASTVTVIRDGLEDDAVRAIWNEFHLTQDGAGAWRLAVAHEAYRCRRGGQTDHFAADLCP